MNLQFFVTYFPKILEIYQHVWYIGCMEFLETSELYNLVRNEDAPDRRMWSGVWAFQAIECGQE